jgi:NADH dehydrogenase FAD-containing subunit
LPVVLPGGAPTRQAEEGLLTASILATGTAAMLKELPRLARTPTTRGPVNHFEYLSQLPTTPDRAFQAFLTHAEQLFASAGLKLYPAGRELSDGARVLLEDSGVKPALPFPLEVEINLEERSVTLHTLAGHVFRGSNRFTFESSADGNTLMRQNSAFQASSPLTTLAAPFMTAHQHDVWRALHAAMFELFDPAEAKRALARGASQRGTGKSLLRAAGEGLLRRTIDVAALPLGAVDGALVQANRLQALGWGDSLHGMSFTVVGGGYAGLEIAHGLSALGAKVLLIDLSPDHVPIAELPKVLAGEKIEISQAKLARQRGYTFLQAKVTGVDSAARALTIVEAATGRERTLKFNDGLIIANGGKSRGTAQEGAYPFRLASEGYALRDALAAARRERAPGRPVRVAVAGLGATSLELAGEIKEMGGDELDVVAAGRSVTLPTHNDWLKEEARANLEALGARAITGVNVVARADGLQLSPEGDLDLEALGAPPDGKLDADITVDAMGAVGAAGDLGMGDEHGMISTDATLRIPGTDIWVAGDVAQLGRATAHNAEEQGKLVVHNIRQTKAGRAPAPFNEDDPGWAATIGSHAVGELKTRLGTQTMTDDAAVAFKTAIDARHRLTLAGLPDAVDPVLRRIAAEGPPPAKASGS